MDFIKCTSGHFESAFNVKKNIRPLNGSAKWICLRSQVAKGHSQGCDETFGGAV